MAALTPWPARPAVMARMHQLEVDPESVPGLCAEHGLTFPMPED